MIFVAGIVLLVLLAVLFVAVPLWRQERRAGAALAGVFMAGIAMGLYLLIGRADLGLSPPRALDENQPQDVIAMVETLAERLDESPEDPEGWTMLGRAYVLMGRYQEAVNAFREALNRTPGEDADLLASYAEARALSDPTTLEGEAGALFERVLELDPENPRGLWYGGLAAQSRGDDTVALERWRKLLASELPAEFRQVVEGRVASIDPSHVDALVSVRVDIAPELAGAIPPGGVLFVFLRAEDDPGQGPPLAARRVSFFEFPETLPLTRDDLLRGDRLPEGTFTVTARLSADGEPARGAGDLEGSVKWDPRSASNVELSLDTRHRE
ncbi:MAG: tetratricopeptide repeat protein [Proteobacteria bacterium]|nr:tetratricopeptide repeat protein [Pseudomonadota bacterium]